MSDRIEIVENEGGFEVHVYPPVTPVIAGRFADRAFAETFRAALKKEPVSTPTSPPAEFIRREPRANQAAQPAAEPAPDLAPEMGTNADESPDEDDDDAIWKTAMDRIAEGEKLKAVADDLDLSFFALRAKWANARKSGLYPDPKDAPVSGGVGGVLERGAKQSAWSSAQDEAIMAADDSALPDLARLYNVPLYAVTRRRDQLQDRITRAMQGTSP